MQGLVAVYMIFYPSATPAMPIIIDRGVYLEKRFCGMTSKAFHPQAGKGKARIVCK